MKTLKSFEAFRLEKSQMAKVSGGTVCDIQYKDDLGGTMSLVFQSDDKEALEAALWEQHPDATLINCW